ncbi:hypothetical protein CC78DRAFT_277823 [Lojkania enalia]|uniref:DUF7587 domain-containing protein n=1 Tax=Lojkania enalia TaxID=147567 RepID=A0A9P4N9Z5_9PLEO|nr:hypothetical protein CC78DRAFT_277823 [Didymosphaeria enalia]
MVPDIYWRVQDEHSRARFRKGEGILAEDAGKVVDFNDRNMVRHELELHLDWANRRPTPFISCYADYNTALCEAERRINKGKRDVWLLRIDLKACWGEVEFREVRRLAGKTGIWIEEYAWHNSESEYIFLHGIPYYAVRRVKRGLRSSKHRDATCLRFTK